MIVTLKLDSGRSVGVRVIHMGDPKDDYAVVEEISTCPACGATHGDGLPIHGTGIASHDHDTYYTDAVALCCRRHVGRLQARVSTIFGIEEDNAVAERCRVY